LTVVVFQLVRNQGLEVEVEQLEAELDTLLNIQDQLPDSCPASALYCLEC
jgi:hypothetical protein